MTITDKQRRVVVTGLGVVAPNGIGKTAFWHAISAGIPAISALEHSEMAEHSAIRVAGVVRDFVAGEHLERKLLQRTDRMTHFALAAIQEAIADAHLDMSLENPHRVGAVIANSMGGMDYVLRQLHALYQRGPRFMSAFTATAWLHVANVGQAAIRYGIQGYSKTPVNDTVGGLDALGTAYTALKRGAADVLFAGGCEAFLHPFILLILAQQGQHITTDDPTDYRPFDRRAAGLIAAEGAGICILEEYEHAVQRGAPIYGEIVGFGQTNDAHGLQAPSADGTRYAKAICRALQEGNIAPEQIAYFSLDGRAIPSSDLGEADALHLALGPHLAHIPLSVPRTMIGHSYAAAGALDTIIALLALQERKVPPTLHCEEFDPVYRVNLVRERAHPLPTRTEHSSEEAALISGRGVGGANIVLALKSPPA